MHMKRMISAAAMALLVATGVCQAQEDDGFAEVRSGLDKLVPGVQADSIRPAPFEGFAEVLLGAQLVYVSLDGQYLIDGRLIEISTKRDLTEASRGHVRAARLAQVSAGERITYAAEGKKKHRITVFTDIDCGYCRRLHQQMAEYNGLGIEVDYLFFPRAGLQSHSYDKAVSVWCADDPNAAMTLAKAGEEPTPKQCDNPVADHYNMGRELGVTGTPALLLDNGSLIPGYVPPADLLVRLDGLTSGAP